MTQPVSNTTAMQQRIESKIDTTKTDALSVASGGALAFAHMTDMMEFAKVMAISGTAIPKHLRENVGACLAITIQASEWRMSPFAVANKSYNVNDRIAYESQLIAAVILRRAPIVGRFEYSYTGDGDKRRCKVTATTTDGSQVEYESPEMGKITPKNSPLWKADPDQQLGYYTVRSMCRRHFPDVILGVYTEDEMDTANEIRNVTPKPRRDVPAFITQAEPAAEPENLFGAEVEE